MNIHHHKKRTHRMMSTINHSCFLTHQSEEESYNSRRWFCPIKKLWRSTINKKIRMKLHRHKF